MVYTETYQTPQEAKNREYKIKQKKRKSYLDWLVSGKSGYQSENTLIG